MGIRGIDIQVAIQRAAEAEKILQGQTSQSRAGEAGLREEAELARARRQEQPQKTETGDQVKIQREKGGREPGAQGQSGEGEEDETEDTGMQKTGERLRKPIVEGQLDILA